MMNYIWLGLVVLAVLMGGLTGHLQDVANAAVDASKSAVMTIALPLAGVMTFWLGLLRLAEKSGLVAVMARGLTPLLRKLFPDVPSNHPAMGSIVMTIASNMLGLGNASTPIGLRAMQQLDSLNPHPGIATNAMCTFLAINTSSVQLIPVTAIAFLAAAGAKAPTQIIGTAIFGSCCATIAAILSVKLFERLPIFALPAGARSEVATPMETAGEPLPPKPGLPGVVVLLAYVGCFAYITSSLVLADLHPNPSATDILVLAVKAVSLVAIPFLIGFFPLYAGICRIPVYEEFIEGAREGFPVAVKIIAYLVAIVVAASMVRAAGGFQFLTDQLGPLLNAIHFPPDLLPMVLIRPLSGSGANGLFAELVKNHPPDSLICLMGGSILGSTETTFYVLAVYFGSVAVRKTRHAVLAGLCADLAGVAAAVLICNLVFGR